eukprot:4213473-Pyramimonas_sp.AAC.1
MLQCGRGVALEQSEQALLVHVPARLGPVPGQPHPRPLLPSKSRNPTSRLWLLLDELTPRGPVGNLLRLQSRQINKRPAP